MSTDPLPPKTPEELEKALWDACHPVKPGQILREGVVYVQRLDDGAVLHLVPASRDYIIQDILIDDIRTYEPLEEGDQS